jgi:heme-degrading monooxygenase HmoA
VSYNIFWEFKVPVSRINEFEAVYGPGGSWAQLFRKAPGFIEVRLLRCLDRPGQYLTIDRWDSLAAYLAFLERFAGEYASLDSRTEGLATVETPLGNFVDAHQL